MYSADIMADSSYTVGAATITGRTPAGTDIPLPVGGTKFKTNVALNANDSVTTDWMSTNGGFGSILYVIRSDKPSATGGVVVEYSDDGVTALPGGAAITYSDVNMQIQRVLVPKGAYTRITYTNGATTQTTFRFEVKFSTTLVQPTEGSLNLPMTDTALAMYTSSDLQLTDGTAYSHIQRTGNSMNVAVTNNTSQAASAAVTNVTTTGTSSTVLAANTSRKGALFNSLSGTILLKLGTGASATSYSARLVTNGYYELPQPVYTGAITAIGAGTLIVTELT